MIPIALGVFVVSLIGALMVFILYPFAIFLISRLAPSPWTRSDTLVPTVTLVIAARNAAPLIEEKLHNISELDYPTNKLDVVFFVDGSDDDTADLIRKYASERIRVYDDPEHKGKISALNRAATKAKGEILVFNDADSILSTNAIRKLVRHFADARIGGVCGQRVIYREQTDLRYAQERYIRFDSTLKMFESSVGSVASNDGKIYCIRRQLFRPIADAVTDDLFVCLTVVEQGFRFVFDPEAHAHVRVPSRSARHEIERRRRIVCRSLRGILSKWRLANPFAYGPFAFSLIFNRVMRRILPLFLLGLLVSSAMLGATYPAIRVFFLAQLVFYCVAISYPALHSQRSNGSLLEKLHSMAFYFVIGSVGTLLGIFDYLRGRRITRWTPRKTGAA